MVDMCPTAIYRCSKDYSYKTTIGNTRGQLLVLTEGSEYYYATANDIVFLHTVPHGDSLPWLSTTEFNSLMGRYLLDSGKRVG